MQTPELTTMNRCGSPLTTGTKIRTASIRSSHRHAPHLPSNAHITLRPSIRLPPRYLPILSQSLHPPPRPTLPTRDQQSIYPSPTPSSEHTRPSPLYLHRQPSFRRLSADLVLYLIHQTHSYLSTIRILVINLSDNIPNKTWHARFRLPDPHPTSGIITLPAPLIR